jgi:hypothetical protein
MHPQLVLITPRCHAHATLCRASGPASGAGMGSSTAVKHAPPKGVEAPAIAAPERAVKFPPSTVANPAFTPKPVEGLMNTPGLNGLTAGGISGLQTVGADAPHAIQTGCTSNLVMLGAGQSAICTQRTLMGQSCICAQSLCVYQLVSELCKTTCSWYLQGSFQVVAAQPISYTINEVVGLLELNNEVIQCPRVPGYMPWHQCTSNYQAQVWRCRTCMQDVARLKSC